MIGWRVEQRFADAEAARTDHPYTVKLAGTVVALERGGQPASWSALVMQSDGSLVNVLAEHLTVVDPPPSEFETKADNANPSEAENALDRLYRFLEDNFKETDHGGGPIEWSESLLLEFKKELLELGAERDKLATELKKRNRKADKPAEEKPT